MSVKRTILVDSKEYINRATRAAVEIAVSHGEGVSKAEAPADTGALRQSITSGTRGLHGEWGSNLDYAKYVEYGTGPHAIRPKRAGGVLVFKKGGQTIFAKFVNHPGTRPQPFMRPAVASVKANLAKIFRLAFKAAERGR